MGQSKLKLSGNGNGFKPLISGMSAAGGGADNDDLVDLDRALAAALIVWSAARDIAADRVARLFDKHDEGGDGVMTWSEFAAFADECQPGRAVQVDPMRPKLKPPGTKRLKLKCDILLSTSAFKFNLRCYSPVSPSAPRRRCSERRCS
jgi:hypothetical protein